MKVYQFTNIKLFLELRLISRNIYKYIERDLPKEN